MTPLSERERQIARLFARSLSDKQVARELGLSDLTVRKHRGNMQRKLRKLRAANVCALLFAAALAGELARPAAAARQATFDCRPDGLRAAADRQFRRGLDKRAGGCLVH